MYHSIFQRKNKTNLFELNYYYDNDNFIDMSPIKKVKTEITSQINNKKSIFEKGKI